MPIFSNLIKKQLLPIGLAGYFIVCGLLINGGILFASLNLVCLQSIIVAPLGYVNYLYFPLFDPTSGPLFDHTRRIVLLAILGLLYGVVIKALWNVKWWMNLVVIIIVFANSCGYTLNFYDVLGKAIVE